jgi:lysophospholipase L1-like esterase
MQTSSPLSAKFLISSLALNAVLLVPLTANKHLRWTYAQTLSIWLSHFRQPNYVFLGDSLTAGGRMFDRIDTINLGQTGLTTHQIAGGIQGTNKYHPRHIVVMAGTNDAFDEFDEGLMRKDWDTIAAEPRTIIFLAPPTRNSQANQRLTRINPIAVQAAAKNHKQPRVLTELRDTDGLLRASYSVDGVHLTDDAYQFWEQRLP